MADPIDNQQELQRRALALLHAGLLPRILPVQTLGGRGCGAPCSVCNRTIEPSDVELEFEFTAGEAGSVARVCHLHLPCSSAWEIARKAFSVESA